MFAFCLSCLEEERIFSRSQRSTHIIMYCISLKSKSYMSPIHGIREGNGTPLQYSCLENPMDGGAAVHGVTKSRTPLSDFTFTFLFHALEKEMATHSSVLAWRIPGGAWWAAVSGVAQRKTRLK